MSNFILPVLWRDSQRRGLRGVLDVYKSDIPQRQFQDVTISDLVAVLEHKIRGMSGSHNVEAVMLYGTRLSDDRRLEAIIPGLEGGSPRILAVMRVAPANIAGTITVIETLTGKKTQVSFETNDTVANLKLKIQEIEGIPVHEQILAFNNSRLDDCCLLAPCCIKKRSIVYLALKLNRVFLPSNVSSETCRGLTQVNNDLNNVPRWRIASEGLNIEGECTNRTCVAFHQMIIHSFHFESFNLVLGGSILCPVCHFSVKPITCGYYNCAWKYEGIRKRDGVSVTSPWTDTKESTYQNVSPGCAQWRSLLIVVKRRNAFGTTKLTSYSSDPVCKDDICVICWTTFWYVAITTAPCGHRLHRFCSDKWSKWCSDHDCLPSCPICRRQL
ncbi:unnamed protein product [Phytophthora lilii]|uniref:Unnamed protein product n=1 Tax=Phytophthora lilii TaxID=2077276 RepID=A0A9W6THX5_9STRA|nr:unnamed protein product [Phytophthora lilii]